MNQENSLIKHLTDYVAHLESALESSLNMNKALVERQARELSDEEIEVLWEKHCPFDLTAGIDFARAILKKAS